MTFANMGRLGVKAGCAERLVELLTRPSGEMSDTGCLLYEVGISGDEPDTVFVLELWESADAHAASLRLPSVQAAIAEAMPLLSGEMSGTGFDVIGSPLRGRA